MNNIEILDCRKTKDTRDRSDIPLSISFTLMTIHSKLRILDVSHNLLGDDGARAFSSFLEISETVQIIRMNNCGLKAKSC